MSENYNPEEHILVIDKPNRDDWCLNVYGVPYQFCGSDERMRVLIRPRPHDLVWMIRQVFANPERVYDGTDGYKYRHNPGDGIQYSLDGTHWVNMHIIRDVASATFAPVAQPKDGTWKWMKTLPIDTCLWNVKGAGKATYRKIMPGKRYQVFDTLTGEKCDGGQEWSLDMAPIWADGWEICLHHSKPSEPKPGTQHWAQVVTKYLGKCVDRPGKWPVRPTPIVGRYDKELTQFVIDWGDGKSAMQENELSAPGSPYATGWSIHEPTCKHGKALDCELCELRTILEDAAGRIDALEAKA